MYTKRQNFIYRKHLQARVASNGRNKKLSNHIQILLKLLATAISLMVCVWQVGICVYNYMDGITGTKSLTRAFPSITFPVVYLCPLYALTELQTAFKILCNNDLECKDGKLNDLNATLQKIWSLNSVRSITPEFHKSVCRNAVNEAMCEKMPDKANQQQRLDSVRGRCYSLNNEIEWDSKGLSNVQWTIRILANEHLRQDNAVALSLSNHLNHKYLFVDKYFYPNQSKNLEIIAIKEFHRVKPCLTEQEYLTCVNQCYEKAISKKIQTSEANYCLLPFITWIKNMRTCANITEVVETFLPLVKLFLKTKCSCRRRCVKTLFSMVSLAGKVYDDSEIYFHIRYSLNFKDILEEYYVYQISQLFSDLAGNIGFFVGISLMGTLQYFCNLILLLFQFPNTKHTKVANRNRNRSFYKYNLRSRKIF